MKIRTVYQIECDSCHAIDELAQRIGRRSKPDATRYWSEEENWLIRGEQTLCRHCRPTIEKRRSDKE